jgi:TATA-box binding protein (TBP) (component of TFIID and TFIIIB)
MLQQRGGKGVRIRTVNIVARSHLMPPFSLAPLISTYPYDSEKFLSHIAVPHQRALFRIYKSGKVVSLSSKSISDLEASFAWLRSLLSGFGLNLSKAYEITNIVAVARIAPPLDLRSLAPFLPRASYDPAHNFELTADEHLVDAVVYYFLPSAIKPRQTALIFGSGRAVLTGFRSPHVLRAAARRLATEIATIIEDHPEVLAVKRRPTHHSSKIDVVSVAISGGVNS